MTLLKRSSLLKRDGLTLQHVRDSHVIMRPHAINQAADLWMYADCTQFLVRTEIRKAYRAAVRSTRRECTLTNHEAVPNDVPIAALPDSESRRETLDWLRSDLDRLHGETDLVSHPPLC
jgi:hypothetical protein